MPFYAKDNPVHAKEALESVARQTRKPDELVVVEDGPVPAALRSVLDCFVGRLPMQRIALACNSGLGRALAHGLDACAFYTVVRMDADDIATEDRFARQETFLRAHPAVVLVGSAVEEFREVPGDLGRLRRVPHTDEQIRRRSKTRNPFNHMSVMFSKQAVIDAGGYRHCPGFEDYDLWLRVLQDGGKVANLEDVLVHVRIGNGMLQRRRGWAYLRSELQFLRSCRERGLLSSLDVTRSALSRIPMRLAPAAVLDRVYSVLLRGR